VNRDQSATALTSEEVEYLPRDTPSEGRGKVSVKKQDQGKL
jgi:hypothetical protein